MWRRDVCDCPPEHWGSTPEDWERRRIETHLSVHRTITEWRAAGYTDACIAKAIRDDLEGVEVCGINIELLNRTGSFDNPAWIERRSLAARARLEATSDPLLLPGYRKLVRKWEEEIMRFQVEARVKSHMACGDQAAAEVAWREFVAWMKRPDRKAFDETG
jgi:hypothetical protein